jgi:hypothetical protein
MEKSWQKYAIDMSTVFSRVRDKQYRNVVIYIVLSSIWLIFLLSKLVAAYKQVNKINDNYFNDL